MGKSTDDLVQLATIGAVHGLKGDVKVQTFTADPLGLAGYGPLFDKTGRCFEIEHIHINKNAVIVRFSGIDERNKAEALNGTRLYVNRSQLPDDLEDDEFYQTDLVGLDVKDEHGKVQGKVNALFDFGGGDILELRLENGKLVLIPFSKAAVPLVDIENGFIVIHPVAAGIVEEPQTNENGAE
ncbi:ribosome maturation factor RimM [uncultured Bartonella sp.]|uniref:ribosome maturation factor RimM n=1 Tax=uncultured Bartonella sp. TaxID=104108 RepID=UPI002611524A|nr:ribosome maturation factor RimM [uncultured Bartonella sp.]